MSISLVLNEQIILHNLINYPEHILRFDKNYFVSQLGQDLFNALKNSYLEGFELNIENIIIFGNKLNHSITKELIVNLLGIPFEPKEFDIHLKRLKKDYAKHIIENKILKETLIETSSKGELNVKKLEELREQITECLEAIKGKESLLINTEQLMNNYKIAILQRNKGLSKYESGDSYLDSYLTMGFAPSQMTLIYGGTGEGKSIYALHLISKQINKQIPSLYLSLENDDIMTTDRLIAMRTGIPYKQFYVTENDGLNEEVIKIVEKEREELSRIKTFYFVKEPDLSLNDIEILIKETKRKMNTNYLVCTIDLLTMVKEFGKDISASNIESAINELHIISRRQNVHFVNVVQANSNNDYTPKNISDVYRCRPSLKNIMNSKALGHRSRIVISIFRPKMYVENFFGSHMPEVEIMDDTLECRIEKQNMGKRGNLTYLFDGNTFKLYKYNKDKQL